MFNKKQFRILIVALIVVIAIGMVYAAVKNKKQGGDGSGGTIAFTTVDPGEMTADTASDPGPDDSSGETVTEQDTEAETTADLTGESPDTASEPESTAETEEGTPAPTTEETTAEETTTEETTTAPPDGMVHENGISVAPDGEYTDKDHVALYLHAFGHLPSNYITKEEAEELGWVASKGNLWEVAPGKSIGGSHFGNYEKLLPTKKGRKYYECDIDYKGKGRGAKRIIYSNDGLIFYTDDHYESFEQLY